ncbi:hypothetical protein ACW73L_21650 [Methylolobus aquaticus]
MVTIAFGSASVGSIDSSADDPASAVPLSVLPLIRLVEIAVLTVYLSLLSLAMPIGLIANAIVAVVAIVLL